MTDRDVLRTTHPHRMITSADYEENLVTPSKPVQQASKGTQGLIKRTITDSNRQVDDRYLLRNRRFISFTLK